MPSPASTDEFADLGTGDAASRSVAKPASEHLGSGSTVWRKVLAVRSLPPVIDGVTFQDCLFVGPASVVVGAGSTIESLVGCALRAELRDPQLQLGYAVMAHPRIDLLEAADTRFLNCRFVGGGFAKVLLFIARDDVKVLQAGLTGGAEPTSLAHPRLPRPGAAPTPPPIPLRNKSVSYAIRQSEEIAS